MAFDIKPRSGRLGPNEWLRAFFPLKIRPSQSYDPFSSPSINVKTGSPDLADFSTTRLLFH
jgi:hypothetical protein